MPKKPLTTYFRFLGEIRPIVTKQNPDLKVTELIKVMAQKKKYLQEFDKFKTTPEGKEILDKMKQDGKEK